MSGLQVVISSYIVLGASGVGNGLPGSRDHCSEHLSGFTVANWNLRESNLSFVIQRNFCSSLLKSDFIWIAQCMGCTIAELCCGFFFF